MIGTYGSLSSKIADQTLGSRKTGVLLARQQHRTGNGSEFVQRFILQTNESIECSLCGCEDHVKESPQ